MNEFLERLGLLLLGGVCVMVIVILPLPTMHPAPSLSDSALYYRDAFNFERRAMDTILARDFIVNKKDLTIQKIVKNLKTSDTNGK